MEKVLDILKWWAEKKDVTTEELDAELEKHGMSACYIDERTVSIMQSKKEGHWHTRRVLADITYVPGWGEDTMRMRELWIHPGVEYWRDSDMNTVRWFVLKDGTAVRLTDDGELEIRDKLPEYEEVMDCKSTDCATKLVEIKDGEIEM